MKHSIKYLAAAALLAAASGTVRAAIPMDRCIAEAAEAQGIDKNLIWAVKLKESRHRADANILNVNANGTEDMGPMQVNTLWLPYLKARGIGREHLLGAGCEGVHAGAMILSDLIRRHGLEDAVGYYHSAVPRHKEPYQADVLAMWRRLSGGEPPSAVLQGGGAAVAVGAAKSAGGRRSPSLAANGKNPFLISLL